MKILHLDKSTCTSHHDLQHDRRRSKFISITVLELRLPNKVLMIIIIMLNQMKTYLDISDLVIGMKLNAMKIVDFGGK